jgi:hypothetical protein
MSDRIDTTLAAVRVAVALLTALPDAARLAAVPEKEFNIQRKQALLVARALDRWLLSGETLDVGLDLPGDWRWRLRMAARDAALQALVALHGGLDNRALAQRIVAGVDAAPHGGVRADGELGLFQDLAHADAILEEDTWRKLIAALRGKRAPRDAHGAQPSSAAKQEGDLGSTESIRRTSAVR